MVTPDRFPGTRQEDEVKLDAQATEPTEDGAFRYVTGSGFRFRELGETKGLTGSGLSPAQHAALDTLLHGLAEDCYLEIVRDSGKVTNAITWTDAGKTVKIRETVITRSVGKVSQIDVIQYDGAGSESSRLVGTVARSSDKVVSITLDYQEP